MRDDSGREDMRSEAREGDRRHLGAPFERNPAEEQRHTQRRAPREQSGKPSINDASVEELRAVPSIDGELADRIVSHRPFRSSADVDELFQVGDKRLEYLREHLRMPDDQAG